MRKTPYQKLPYPDRVLLWWRHMPIPCIKGCLKLAWWAVHGARRMNIGDDEFGEWWLSRREVAGLIWRSETTLAHSRMGDVFTLQEVLDDIRDSHPEEPPVRPTAGRSDVSPYSS